MGTASISDQIRSAISSFVTEDAEVRSVLERANIAIDPATITIWRESGVASIRVTPRLVSINLGFMASLSLQELRVAMRHELLHLGYAALNGRANPTAA